MTMSTLTFATKPTPPIAGHALGVVDQLLRDSGTFLEQIERETDQLRVAKTLILTIVVGTAAFGGAIGAFRMGPQPLFAGLKLPLVVLFTAGLTTPAFTALARRSTKPLAETFRADLLLVLSSLAMTSLVLAALVPVLLLGVMLGIAYHAMVLLVVGCCAIAGAAGLVLFLRGVSRRAIPGAWLSTLVALTVFGLVGSQLAWTFRPFVARPRANVELVRTIEGSFIEAIGTSFDSARGVYTRDSAPLPEEE
jgi:hypothetical protein